MKKTLILTSILALAACGGGSGGGGSSYNNETPNNPNPISNIALSVDNSAETINYAVSRGVVSDGANYETVLQKFQNMYNIGNGTNTNPTTDELRTAYILAGGNADDFNEATAQSFITSNYTSVLNDYFTPSGSDYVWAPITQSISDINFRTEPYGDEMQINMSDGQITSIKIQNVADINDGGFVTWNQQGENTFTTANRYIYGLSDSVVDAIISQGASGFMEELFKVMSESELTATQIKNHLIARIDTFCPACSSETVTNITNIINNISDSDIRVAESKNPTLTFAQLGKEAGLSFADFGYYAMASDDVFNGETTHDVSYDIFAGGYDLKEVDKPDQNMYFSGSAVAMVTSHSDEDDVSMITHTNSANLHLSDGTETLTMNFSSAETPWYDVVITRTPNDPYDQSHNTITINNTNNVNDRIAEDFRMTETMKTHAQQEVRLDNTYYGDNGIAKEVLSSADFLADKAHTTFDPNSTEMLEFNSVFGGKTAQQMVYEIIHTIFIVYISAGLVPV